MEIKGCKSLQWILEILEELKIRYPAEVIEFMKKYHKIVGTYSRELRISINELMKDGNRWAFTDSFPFALDIGNAFGLEKQQLDREQIVSSGRFQELIGNFFSQGMDLIKAEDKERINESLIENLYGVVEYGYQVGVSGKELNHKRVASALGVYAHSGLEEITQSW